MDNMYPWTDAVFVTSDILFNYGLVYWGIVVSKRNKR